LKSLGYRYLKYRSKVLEKDQARREETFKDIRNDPPAKSAEEKYKK
jgi:hypothetical protein